MKRKKKPIVVQEESLLPAVKEEEERLNRLLEETRAEAERTASEAEREAAERVRSTRERLPSIMEEKRNAALLRLEAQAATKRQPEGELERKVVETAEAKLGAAVQVIVSAVVPGGSP